MYSKGVFIKSVSFSLGCHGKASFSWEYIGTTENKGRRGEACNKAITCSPPQGPYRGWGLGALILPGCLGACSYEPGQPRWVARFLASQLSL